MQRIPDKNFNYDRLKSVSTLFREAIEREREGLNEASQAFDKDVLELSIRFIVPKSLKGASGRFLGLDRIKNDLRGIEDVTTVSTEETENEEDHIIVDAKLKINVRMEDMEPSSYVRKKLVPAIEAVFGKEGGHEFQNRPKLIKIGKPEYQSKTPRFTPQTVIDRFKRTI